MSLPGPDARVVELRVPGLIGVDGDELLDSVAAVTVAGDETGEIVRPADRLRRPVAGPVLHALGRAIPRTVEGYLWHKMTSGGATKAAWALLFPFSLANVAHGMLPPAPEGSRVARVLVTLSQAVLRVFGLLLTALFVTQVGVISLDLLAAQCLAPGTGCLAAVPDVAREGEIARTLFGMLPPLLVIVALYRVSAGSWQRTGIPVMTALSRPSPDAVPGHSLYPHRNAGVLRGLHTMAALACVALLPLGGVFTPPSGTAAFVVWLIALGFFGLTAVATMLLDDIADWLRTLLPSVIVAGLLIVGVALVVVAALIGSPLTAGAASGTSATTLPGVDAMAEGLIVLLLAAAAVFGVVLAPLALLARRQWRTLPHRLRPWLGGWVAAPTVVLACLLGAGFGAGAAITVRQLLGGRELVLPPSYTLLTVLWGAGTVIAALLWAGMYLVAIPLRKRLRGIPRIVRILQTDAREQRTAADAWATAIIERKHLHRLVAAMVLLLGVGAVPLVALRVTDRPLPVWLEPFAGLGVVALGLLAAGLVRTVYAAVRYPRRRRHLGALADLVFFWPRRAHPIVPPSYAVKVVPDLVERVRYHLREPETRVVLAGYSHGGLLAMIAAARLSTELSDQERERVGLITAGTPAQWGYQRAFPSLLSPATLGTLYGALDGRWRGLCRGTDSFGGGVTTWRHQVVGGQLLGIGYLTDGTIGPLPAAVRGRANSLVLGGDHWLADPVPHVEECRRWAAGVLRHTDYLVDPEWDRAVAMAAGLEIPGTAVRPAQEQTSLFPDLPRPNGGGVR
ncbi:hypothetical protein [Haloechinothrix salitolerans]|uniref:Integral membrane protein n=1 Tax=Haloechinothrix salitolerans TaxID=926830 RepID=A0ABW2BYZ9_9PSEU